MAKTLNVAVVLNANKDQTAVPTIRHTKHGADNFEEVGVIPSASILELDAGPLTGGDQLSKLVFGHSAT